MLVQPADLLANFGVAAVKAHLRSATSSASSLTEAEKARIFNAVASSATIPTGTLSVTAANVLAGSIKDNLRLQLTVS